MDNSNFENAKADSLKVNAELTAKLEKFPHIVERIIHLWGTHELDTYLNSLLIADRPNRAGFPVDVASAIHKLIVANDKFIAAVFA